MTAHPLQDAIEQTTGQRLSIDDLVKLKTQITTYGARPISRKGRRSKVEIEFIKTAIARVLSDENPMTVRQVFYRLVSLGVIEKTENEYKSTVCRLLTDMRRGGDVPYRWIADNTRWMRKPATYSNLEQAIQETAQFYRRRLWDDQEVYVEIWLEKDALSGVLYPITAKYDVPLMVTRGYPSLSFLHSAAEGHSRRGQADLPLLPRRPRPVWCPYPSEDRVGPARDGG